MMLPFMTDGYGADTAHPRFVAVMLRLADLMDIDSGRVNPFQVRLSVNSVESMAHQEKHLAVRSVLTSPTKLSARFDFNSAGIKKNVAEYGEGVLIPGNTARADAIRVSSIRAQAAREAFAWFNMLRTETGNFALHWHNIVPEGYTGSAPTIEDNKQLIFFDGVPVNAKDLDLRYVLSYVRAFEIIRGAGLYRDRVTFIRELVQNAMDATKIQLFLDWESSNGEQKDLSIQKFFSLLPSHSYSNVMCDKENCALIPSHMLCSAAIRVEIEL
jgi:hypothetical protein